MNEVITEVAFKELDYPSEGMIDVYGKIKGKWKGLFVYYKDEITFDENELIGLTPEEARQLRLKKDLEYLRS